MNQNLLLILCLSWINLLGAVEIPQEFRRCHFGDYPCMVNSTNEILTRFRQGYPNLGLPPFDTIPLDDVTLVNSPGPIYIFYQLTNQVIKGFENTTVLRISGFDRDPEQNPLEIELRVPRLKVMGNYKFEGRGILVYSNTTGKTSSELQNVHITVSLKGYIEYRQGKRYLRIYDIMPQVEMDRWILSNDDLYKENTDLSVLLNRVVNNNWLEFWNEIEPTILPVYSRSFARILEHFSINIPYDDLFLPPHN